MTRLTTYLLLAGCAITAACTAVRAGSSSPRSLSEADVHIYKTVDGTKLRLFVVAPSDLEEDDRRPAIVFYHGGGWRGGNPSQFAPHSTYLASRGMVAVNVEYRLKGKHGVFPHTCVEDAKSAMRWVRAHADELNIDADRIAAGGGSAGGHLAACLATIDGYNAGSDDTSISARPDALALFNPVIRMRKRWKKRMAPEVPRRSISPSHHVDGDVPPTIIFHGTDDTTVPIEDVREFCRKMKRHGNDCRLVEFEGMKHAFFNYGKHGNRPYRRSVYKTDRFLAGLGFLSGDPRIEPPSPEGDSAKAGPAAAPGSLPGVTSAFSSSRRTTRASACRR